LRFCESQFRVIFSRSLLCIDELLEDIQLSSVDLVALVAKIRGLWAEEDSQKEKNDQKDL